MGNQTDAFLAGRPQLAAAFAANAAYLEAPGEPIPGDRRPWASNVLVDMLAKLKKYGSLSDKQINFAVSLGETMTKAPVAENYAPTPEGRVRFTGMVVSQKTKGGDYGSQEKITIKVTNDDGSVWLAWGTAPQAALWDSGEFQNLKGRTITMTASLTRGSDEHFAFFKRPAKPEVHRLTVEEAEAEAIRDFERVLKVTTNELLSEIRSGAGIKDPDTASLSDDVAAHLARKAHRQAMTILRLRG